MKTICKLSEKPTNDEIVTKVYDLRCEILTIAIQRDNATDSLKTRIKELEQEISEIENPLNEDIEERKAEEDMLTELLWENNGKSDAPTTTENWELVPKFTHGKKVDIISANQQAVEMGKEGEFLKLVSMTQADCKKFFGTKISKKVMVDKEPEFKSLELNLTPQGIAKRMQHMGDE